MDVLKKEAQAAKSPKLSTASSSKKSSQERELKPLAKSASTPHAPSAGKVN